MNTIRGLASIIVPCWGQLEFTRQCVAALKSQTQPPWESIVIDNGSTDHTDIYLAGVSDGAVVPVTVISNSKNLGFPAAINQWLKAARGEYLVLLNNDVVETDGWLGQLIGLENAKKDVAAEHGELKTKEETGGDLRSIRVRGLETRAQREDIPTSATFQASTTASCPQAGRWNRRCWSSCRRLAHGTKGRAPSPGRVSTAMTRAGWAGSPPSFSPRRASQS
jgi:glycosyltransferase involved in cell wall biosynthesis